MFIPLATMGFYKEQGQTIFPWIVTPVLGFQLCFCAVVIAVNRRGVGLMRWNEGPRGELWAVEQRGRSEREREGARREAAEVIAADRASAESEAADLNEAIHTPMDTPHGPGLLAPGADEESRGLLNHAAQSAQEEEYVDAPDRIDDGDPGPSNQVAEPSEGLHPEFNVAAQQNNGPVEILAPEDGGLEGDSLEGYGNFQAQRHDRRFFLILWKTPRPRVKTQ